MTAPTVLPRAPLLQAEANDRLPHPRLRRLANRAPVAMLGQNPRVGVEAIDVIPNPPRRDDPLVQIHRRHAAHREAVAPVDVGHRYRAAHDARQKRHIRYLLGRLVLLDLPYHLLAGEDETVHAHAGLVVFRNAPAVLVNLLQRTLPHLAHSDLPRRVYLGVVARRVLPSLPTPLPHGGRGEPRAKPFGVLKRSFSIRRKRSFRTPYPPRPPCERGGQKG